MKCGNCGCDPCKAGKWIDGSWYANDPNGHHAAIVHFCHTFFTRENRAFVMLVRAQIAAMPAAVVYPCVSCSRYAFPQPGTRCYWCRQIGHRQPAVAPVAVSAGLNTQASQVVTPSSVRPSWDELREKMLAAKPKKRASRRR